MSEKCQIGIYVPRRVSGRVPIAIHRISMKKSTEKSANSSSPLFLFLFSSPLYLLTYSTYRTLQAPTTEIPAAAATA